MILQSIVILHAIEIENNSLTETISVYLVYKYLKLYSDYYLFMKEKTIIINTKKVYSN